MDFTVSQNVLELVLQDAHFCLKKLALAFLTDCVCWFLTPLKMCISWGIFDANAERLRMFLCWSRAVKSVVNQGLYLFLVLHFLNRACLFKMLRKALLKSNQASSTDRIKLMSFQDTRARSIRKACLLKCFRECLTVMKGGRLTANPVRTQVMKQWSLRSWLVDSRGVFRGKVVQDDIYEGAHGYWFRVVPGRFLYDLCEIESIKLRL